MFGSTNLFFAHINKFDLVADAKLKMINLLIERNRSETDINKYSEAFDYFVRNPQDFDGATGIKDLVDIRYGTNEFTVLDLDAMQHDYDCICGDNRSVIKFIKSNFRYIKNIRLNGKGYKWHWLWFLNLIAIPFVLYKLLTEKSDKYAESLNPQKDKKHV